jgi:hypothetical protein
MGWRRDRRTADVLRGAVALRLSRDMTCNEPRSLAAAQRKNPPRMAAGGFQAKQITLNKTPWFTGPVNRRSDFLSTSGPVLSRALNHSTTSRPGKRAKRAQAGTHTRVVALGNVAAAFYQLQGQGLWVPAFQAV